MLEVKRASQSWQKEGIGTDNSWLRETSSLKQQSRAKMSGKDPAGILLCPGNGGFVSRASNCDRAKRRENDSLRVSSDFYPLKSTPQSCSYSKTSKLGNLPLLQVITTAFPSRVYYQEGLMFLSPCSFFRRQAECFLMFATHTNGKRSLC